MFTKKHILEEIRRTAVGNGGVPLGTGRFRAETGIKTSDWQAKFWARWGDALIEAGFTPNELTTKRDDDDLLASLAALTRELGHVPVANEIKLRARSQDGFPWHNSFNRFGNKLGLVRRLHEYCVQHGLEDVAAICAQVTARTTAREIGVDAGRSDETSSWGYVYLMRSGTNYKIGRTNAVGRRERELAIQLPEAIKLVHSIKTDDPPGIRGLLAQAIRTSAQERRVVRPLC